MATDTRSLSAYLADNATFQAWATGIDDQIKDMGWVQTSDTGQVDVTTVARPAAGAYAGYRIYRMDDSLQSTSPVFLKLEYGCGGVNDRPALRAQLSSCDQRRGHALGEHLAAAHRCCVGIEDSRGDAQLLLLGLHEPVDAGQQLRPRL